MAFISQRLQESVRNSVPGLDMPQTYFSVSRESIRTSTDKEMFNVYGHERAKISLTRLIFIFSFIFLSSNCDLPTRTDYIRRFDSAYSTPWQHRQASFHSEWQNLRASNRQKPNECCKKSGPDSRQGLITILLTGALPRTISASSSASVRPAFVLCHQWRSVDTRILRSHIASRPTSPDDTLQAGLHPPMRQLPDPANCIP
jgi:hypothetical protein